MADYDNYEVEVWEGIPYVEILKFARERNGDLIVMAHHTREVDPDDAVLGSTVEQVVLRAACPVASVNRPDKVS
jgi:nucleotide-binding universal stress UspA family protein